MNHVLKGLSFIALSVCSLTGFSQKINMEEGDLAILKNEKTINIEMTYDNVKVGKYDKESEYVSQKKDDMNNKKPGTGDTWAKGWEADKGDRYRDKFEELFNRECPSLQITNDHTAKYTILYKTTFLEPGFNIGITRKNAQHNAELWIVDASNKSKVLAKISVEKALGRTMSFSDYDTGARLAETYADAGKALGEFFAKKIK